MCSFACDGALPGVQEARLDPLAEQLVWQICEVQAAMTAREPQKEQLEVDHLACFEAFAAVLE